MKNQIQIILFLIFFTLIISGCKKDDSNSPAKIDNVNYKATSWSYSSPEYYVNIPVNELTSDKTNTASVNVYYSTDAGLNWTALPFTQYNGINSNYLMGFTYKIGSVRVTWIYNSSLSAGNDPNTYYSTIVEFKVVIVSSAARKANPDLDLNDYNAVKECFEIKE